MLSSHEVNFRSFLSPVHLEEHDFFFVESGCDGIDENKMKERKIKIMDQEGSDASVILSFSCGSGIQDRKYGRLFCNGSHWHGDTSLCEGI